MTKMFTELTAPVYTTTTRFGMEHAGLEIILQVEVVTLTHLTGTAQEETTTSTEQYILNNFFNHASKHRT